MGPPLFPSQKATSTPSFQIGEPQDMLPTPLFRVHRLPRWDLPAAFWVFKEDQGGHPDTEPCALPPISLASAANAPKWGDRGVRLVK